MPKIRFVARPIAEGITESSTGHKLIWREFRWNTGRTSKMWFVDPEDVTDERIEIRELRSTGDSAGEL